MSTDLVGQVDPAQRLAACEAALLSMTEKRDAAEAEVERLTAERDEARETNRSFHRRVQYAERFRLARKDLERIFWLLVRRHIKREVDADRRAKTAEASLAAERRRVEELEKVVRHIAEQFDGSEVAMAKQRNPGFAPMDEAIRLCRAALAVKQEG